METSTFRVKSYSWQEMALLYNPEMTPKNAVKCLSGWVERNPVLKQELIAAGWCKGIRTLLTPLQVRKLVEFLGEP